MFPTNIIQSILWQTVKAKTSESAVLSNLSMFIFHRYVWYAHISCIILPIPSSGQFLMSVFSAATPTLLRISVSNHEAMLPGSILIHVISPRLYSHYLQEITLLITCWLPDTSLIVSVSIFSILLKLPLWPHSFFRTTSFLANGYSTRIWLPPSFQWMLPWLHSIETWSLWQPLPAFVHFLRNSKWQRWLNQRTFARKC